MSCSGDNQSPLNSWRSVFAPFRAIKGARRHFHHMIRAIHSPSTHFLHIFGRLLDLMGPSNCKLYPLPLFTSYVYSFHWDNEQFKHGGVSSLVLFMFREFGCDY